MKKRGIFWTTIVDAKTKAIFLILGLRNQQTVLEDSHASTIINTIE